MIGTLVNALAIVVGSALGATVRKDLSAWSQVRLKVLLGAFTVYAGLGMAWNGFGGSFWHRAAQLGIGLVALALGSFTGRVLRLQKGANALGKLAQRKFAESQESKATAVSDGFVTCSLIFCLGPLAVLGALQDGLLGTFRVLIAKSVLDGLAAFGFAKVFGWSVMLAAIPVLAYQGSLTLAAELGETYLRNPALLESIGLTAGLIVFSVALMILDLRKVRVADYLPSLIYAPLLTHFWLPK